MFLAINFNFSTLHYPSVDISSSESFLRGGNKPTLNIESAGHAVHVFINGQFSGIVIGLFPPEAKKLIYVVLVGQLDNY